MFDRKFFEDQIVSVNISSGFFSNKETLRIYFQSGRSLKIYPTHSCNLSIYFYLLEYDIFLALRDLNIYSGNDFTYFGTVNFDLLGDVMPNTMLLEGLKTNEIELRKKKISSVEEMISEIIIQGECYYKKNLNLRHYPTSKEVSGQVNVRLIIKPDLINLPISTQFERDWIGLVIR